MINKVWDRILTYEVNYEKQSELWDTKIIMKNKIWIMTCKIIIMKNKLGIVRYKVHFQQEMPHFMLVFMKKNQLVYQQNEPNFDVKHTWSCESTTSLCISMSLECHSLCPKNTVSASFNTLKKNKFVFSAQRRIGNGAAEDFEVGHLVEMSLRQQKRTYSSSLGLGGPCLIGFWEQDFGDLVQ